MCAQQDLKTNEHLCAICKEPVQLEKAKTDGDGHAVHEDCYCETLKESVCEPSKKTG